MLARRGAGERSGLLKPASPARRYGGDADRDIEHGPNGHPPRVYPSWWRLALFIAPYCWPRSTFLRLSLASSFAFAALSKASNLISPLLLGYIVDGLSTNRAAGPTAGPVGILVDANAVRLVLWCVAGYAVAKFITILSSELRGISWQQVSLATTRAFSASTFEHLHGLSLGYHLTRKTGEVLRVMDRGVSALSTILQVILFTLGPTIAELLVVCLIFARLNSPGIAAVIFTSAVLYVVFSVFVTQWRTALRRLANQRSNSVGEVATDSLLNFETVKYFGAEEYEVNRYSKLLKDYQDASMQAQWSLSFLNAGQSLIVNVAVGVAMFMAARGSIMGYLTAGDFVMITTYVVQLYTPLSFLGSTYRILNQSFTDMEHMLQLRELVPEVKDAPGARDLQIGTGEVVFDDVSFEYGAGSNGKIQNVSFRCPPGKKIAIVGPTGSGKSTIIRLLLRFYNVQKGRILIDGQDLMQVKQASIRRSLGIVAQDSVLFNDTIGFNVSYSRPEASTQDILKAIESAQLLDFVEQLPEGLNSTVGERGLRLSGGERQRMAIARCCLIKPSIVLLDEATSALDTTTEKAVQAALKSLCEGQTTIAIAHRLSTIVDADEILVLTGGIISERGTHEELLNLQGSYYDMWSAQKNREPANGDF